MLNRLLAVPAVVCVALAGVLGTWGWAGREESRDQAAEEDLRAEVEEFLVPPDSGSFQPEMDVLYIQACDALLRAATLDRTAGAGTVDPGVAPDPTSSVDPGTPMVTVPAEDAARALLNMLDPIVVVGLPGLDEPAVLDAMEHLRDQINASMEVGHDPFASPNVQGAAQELGVVVAPRC